MRADGTSRFAKKDRWGYFPSVSAGWRFTEERFMEGVRHWWDNGKIRLSYGALGNQQVSNYLYLQTIGTGTLNYLFDDSGKASYASVSDPMSSNLTWETVYTYNLGLDLSFLQNRLSFTGDFFIRDTKDMLTQSLTLPSVYGAATPTENCADLRTKGWELSITWRDQFKLGGKPFHYALTGQIGDYQTEITKYNNPTKLFDSYYEGKKLGEIWGYHVPKLFDTDEEAAASGVAWKQGLGETKEYKFRIQISPLDCTGCSNCVDVCPAKQKALVMKPLESQFDQQKNWEYCNEKVGYKGDAVDKTRSVKNLQFTQPLFEFSGACAGCGETPYIKAITQLFGDKMMVANATGCTSIYSGSAPSTPYCTNAQGQGPAWANSLFEDNAEFGLGMYVGAEKLRDRIQMLMEEAIAQCQRCSEELKGVMREWIEARVSSTRSAEVAARLVPMMEACGCDYCRQILELKDFLVKQSQWVIGGDGWAYDIGFGGLDHVLASGLDVNVLVLDTEVYSNTGGQSSKATPVGAVAKFASAGKRIRKKDLGAIAMTYGYVYVAQVSIGASQAQLFNVLKEAEAYPGPSLVIAYAPCINHGIKGGMTRTQTVGKQAVECGYWHLWHYNPQLEEQGKNPFVLDSKEPDWAKFRDFLLKEVRYTSLKAVSPEDAEALFQAAEQNARWRYEGYVRRSKIEY